MYWLLPIQDVIIISEFLLICNVRESGVDTVKLNHFTPRAKKCINYQLQLWGLCFHKYSVCELVLLALYTTCTGILYTTCTGIDGSVSYRVLDVVLCNTGLSNAHMIKTVETVFNSGSYILDFYLSSCYVTVMGGNYFEGIYYSVSCVCVLQRAK